MKTKVLIICELGGMWHLYNFTTDELLSISSDKGDIVDDALKLKTYRILVVEDREEVGYVSDLLDYNKKKKKIAHEKMEAILKGIFDQAHLKFTRTRVVKHE